MEPWVAGVDSGLQKEVKKSWCT